MIPGLQSIPIKELTAPKSWKFEGYLDELPSLTPVRGKIMAERHGGIIKLKGYIQTIINLACDKCLMNFNQLLKFNSDEIIWIREQRPSQAEIQFDEFAEHLSPLSNFDPEKWVFEQLSLQIPLLKICSPECKAPFGCKAKGRFSSNSPQHEVPEILDSCWSALSKLIRP